MVSDNLYKRIVCIVYIYIPTGFHFNFTSFALRNMQHRETYKLRDWIDINRINWNFLPRNEHPYAIDLLLQNPEKIDWINLSANPKAIHLLEQNPDKIHWRNVSMNPQAIHLLEQHPDKIDWQSFVRNNRNAKILIEKMNEDDPMRNYHHLHYLCKFAKPHEICILEQHLEDVNELGELVKTVNERRAHSTPRKPPMHVPTDNLDWSMLSSNPCAIHLLEKHPDKIDWDSLSYNYHPRAIQLLEENIDKIHWFGLSCNRSPLAQRILEQHHEKVNWSMLSQNSCSWAISLLEKNKDKIDWSALSGNLNPRAFRMLEERIAEGTYFYISYVFLSENPAIFMYNTEDNYEEMKQSRQSLHEELLQNRFHPRNIAKFEDWGFDSGIQSDE